MIFISSIEIFNLTNHKLTAAWIWIAVYGYEHFHFSCNFVKINMFIR